MITWTGHRNPVRCALEWFTAKGYPSRTLDIDTESFERVAALVGDASAEEIANGFLVNSTSDVQRLCDIGNFVIRIQDGKLFAQTAAEWQAEQREVKT